MNSQSKIQPPAYLQTAMNPWKNWALLINAQQVGLIGAEVTAACPKSVLACPFTLYHTLSNYEMFFWKWFEFRLVMPGQTQ